MVLLIIIPMKNGYFIGNIPYFQTKVILLQVALQAKQGGAGIWIAEIPGYQTTAAK